MKAWLAIIGVIVIVVALIFVIDPTTADQYTKPGKYVQFKIFVSKGLWADPNMEQWTATAVSGCGAGQTMSFVGDANTFVNVKIGSYRTIATNTEMLKSDGGTAWLSACSFVPLGQYQIEFTDYYNNVRDDVVYKTLLVDEGVRLS